jgi:hypothetical protein
MMYKVKTSFMLLLAELCNIEVELIEPESFHPCSGVAGCQLKTLSYVVDSSRSSVIGPETGVSSPFHKRILVISFCLIVYFQFCFVLQMSGEPSFIPVNISWLRLDFSIPIPSFILTFLLVYNWLVFQDFVNVKVSDISVGLNRNAIKSNEYFWHWQLGGITTFGWEISFKAQGIIRTYNWVG